MKILKQEVRGKAKKNENKITMNNAQASECIE